MGVSFYCTCGRVRVLFCVVYDVYTARTVIPFSHWSYLQCLLAFAIAVMIVDLLKVCTVPSTVAVCSGTAAVCCICMLLVKLK